MRAAHFFKRKTATIPPMTTFALNYKLHKDEDHATFNEIMAAWEAQQVSESTWILKRNDGCTCQTVMDDLLEHIDAGNDISVVEIKYAPPAPAAS